MDAVESTLSEEEIAHRTQHYIDEINKGINSPRDPRSVDQIFEDIRRECLEKWQSSSVIKQA